MTTVYQLVPDFEQFLDNNGLPLAGGLLYAYVAGTTTLKTTYTESDGITPNANPIVLDAYGRLPYGVYGTTGAYKLVLKSSGGTTIKSRDNITPVNDVAASLTDWTAFGNAVTYISGTSFSVAGDQTNTFTQYRRIKATVTAGTAYGSVVSSTFGGGITTVVMAMDSTSLDSGLSAVAYSILSSQQHVWTKEGGLAFASLSANGYLKLPGGLIMQWGEQAIGASGAGTGTQAVTFPIAFPNNCFQVVPGGQGVATPADVRIGRASITTSGFNLTWACVAGNMSGGTVGTWWAIGN